VPIHFTIYVSIHVLQSQIIDFMPAVTDNQSKLAFSNAKLSLHWLILRFVIFCIVFSECQSYLVELLSADTAVKHSWQLAYHIEPVATKANSVARSLKLSNVDLG